MVIISVSVPQEFVAVMTKVFIPGNNVTVFCSEPVGILNDTLLTAAPFCVKFIPCPLFEF